MRRALVIIAAALAVAVSGGVAGTASGRSARASADAAKRSRASCPSVKTRARVRQRRCARWSQGRAGAPGAAGRAGWSEPAPTGSSSSPPSGPGAGPSALPRRLAVDENEYSILPSRNPVGAGDVQFHVNNFGQDEHDLTITDGITQFGQVLVASGASADLTATLAPGTYRLYCSVLNGLHDAWGMHATLTVQ